MVKEKPKSESLEELAERIVQYVNEADEKIIEADEKIIKAALLIRKVRDQVDRGEAGQTTWTEWAREHIKLSESRLRELQRIAQAEDPQQELKRQRDLTRTRVEKHREKQKVEEAVSLRSSSDKSVKAPASPEFVQQVPDGADSEPGDGHLKERTNEPPLRNGGEDDGAVVTEGADHRARLIIWAKDAPPEKIEKVWAYVQRLDQAASGSETEEVAAPAAA